MAENSDTLRKPRKLWIESTPFTPEGYKDQSSVLVESSPPRVKLTHFTTKPVIDFGHVKIGDTVTRKLVIENPNQYEVDVNVEKFPWKKNFTVNEEIFTVDEGNVHYLEITWMPNQSGNYRELMMLKYDSGFRVHALILGHVDSPKKVKSKIRTRRGKGSNKTLKKSQQIKNLVAMSSTMEAPSHLAENTENVDPSSVINALSDKDATRLTQKTGFPGCKSPLVSSEKNGNSVTRNALLPLRVVNNDNPRDSCGSITAPASPSGLDAPVIENTNRSPLVKVLKNVDNAIGTMNHAPANKDLSTEQQRETFCIDPKHPQLPENRSAHEPIMTEPELTGRPTYVLSAVKNPVPLSASVLTPVANELALVLTPRSRQRSKTFTKQILPSSKEKKKRLSMVDYALAVIGSDKKLEMVPSDTSLPEEGSSEGAAQVDETSSSVSVVSETIHDNTTTSAIYSCVNITTLPSDAIAERLSSTHAHEKTAADAIGTLPVPDISVITGPSPFKAKKRKSSAFSPSKAANPIAKKRSVVTQTKAKKGSPKRHKPEKVIHGTPKGRALLRRRVAKSGASETLPIPKTISGSAKKKARVPGANRLKKQVAESPIKKGAKRANVIERHTVLKKRKVKMPVTQLVLKPTKKSFARSPITVRMSYSARNMYYDERWRQKQEYAFTTWLNYILTPDEFKPSKESKDNLNKGKNKSKEGPNHSEVFPQKSDKGNVTLPALSKEKASLRAYRIRKRLNRLRRSAVNLFESQDVGTVIAKIEEAVESGHIQLRSDKQLWADIGNKAKVTDLLLSFEYLWLRLGLEVTFGEELLSHDSSDTNTLSHFIGKRILSSSVIEQKYAHPTVPHSFKPGYANEISKYILKRFLILIYFLEQAKHHRLIDHDPCLFRKESEFKNCKDILISFSRDLLRGEGDIIKHLSFLGYKVKYQQNYIDEFEYGISNIAIDLRDGIRLVRIVELLFHRHDLTPKMRVPAGSLLQKKHNVNIALKALESHSVDLRDASGKQIEADHIVRGHCEMTLALLWNIASHFQLEKGIDQKALKGEIEYLKRNLRMKHMLENTRNLYESEDSESQSTDIEVSTMLLEWCQLVCAFKSIPVYNFGGAFSDGRIMACLISHYQSNLIHQSQINMKTTQSEKDPDPMQLDVSSSSDISVVVVERRADQAQLLKNEKHNLKLVQNAAYEMGGIPNLLRIDDISNTIPDDKVVKLLVSFLCTRLLDISTEDRAARTVQVAWRAYKYKKLIHAERKAAEEEKKRRILAALVIQAAYKSYKQRSAWKKVKAATLVLQRAWRTRKSTQPERRAFVKLKSTTILLQSLVRSKIAKKTFIRLKQERAKQIAAVSVIQQFWRGKLVQQNYQKKLRSAVVIQTFFRAWRKSVVQRLQYLAYKDAVVKVQRCWRKTLEMRKQVAIFATKREAAVVIQRAFRAYRERKLNAAATCIQRKWRSTMLMRQSLVEFGRKRSAVISIQNAFRNYQAKKTLANLKARQNAAIVIQKKWRATALMNTQKQKFLKMKMSAVILQTAFRSFQARKLLKRLKKESHSAKIIQLKWKSYLLMKNDRERFYIVKKSIMVIQCTWRCFLARRERENLKKKRDAIILIQTSWRASRLSRIERESFQKKKSAAVKVQSVFRCILAKRQLEKLKQRNHAAAVLQRYWKSIVVMKNTRQRYILVKKATVTLQTYVRCMIARKELSNLRNSFYAARVIQAFWRNYVIGKKVRNSFLEQRKACVVVQRCYRIFTAKKLLSLMKLRHASAVKIQRKWRATRAMRIQRDGYLVLKRSAIVIQSFWRCCIALKELERLNRRKAAAIVIQQRWRATILMRAVRESYLKMKLSALVIQSAFRCFMLTRIFTEKKKMWNATVFLQRKWKATLLMKQDRENFVFQKEAAIQIQSLIRRFLAKKVFLKLKKEEHAALVIQRYWRGYIHMKQDQKHFIQVKTSVVTIQTIFRCLQARKHLAKLRLENNAAVVIQSAWKATLIMKQERSEFLRIKSAAIIVQCAWRRFVAVKRMDKLKRERNAAITVQRSWRAFAEMKQQRSRFLATKNAVVVLQRAMRCLLAKRELERLRERRNAAIILQQKWKATLLMRVMSSVYRRKKSAAVIIQCSYRCFRARKTLKSLRRQNDAASVIQTRWRATLLMKRIRYDYLLRKRSAILIQCMLRRCSAKSKLAQLKRRRDAARIIQARWRSMIQMRLAQVEFYAKKKAAITIQRNYRRFCAERTLAHLKMRMQSVRIIQRRWRAILMMKAVREVFLQKRDAAVVIQRAYRCYSSKKKLKLLKRFHWAATVLQERWRAKATAVSERRIYLQKKDAAVKMQSVYRCILAKRILAAKKKQQEAAITIQRWWRIRIAGMLERKLYLQKKDAAIKIQSVCRCILAKKILTTKKRQQAAATCIQSKWRARVAGITERRIYLQKKDAAVMIQSAFRSIMARRILATMKKRHRAATVIQRWWTATVAGISQRKTYLRTKDAIIRIQSVMRCILAKRILASKKKDKAAAITIQAIWRARILGTWERKCYLQKRDAAIKIQSMIRCFLTKRALESKQKQNKAAITIQKWWRAYLRMRADRKSFLQQKKAVIIMQSLFRCILARRFLENLKSQSKAVTLIQCRWRARVLMKRERVAFMEKRQSIIIIQNFFRCMAAKTLLKRLQRENTAIKVIQKWWRGYLEAKRWREEFLRKRKAVIMIQKVFKCLLAKGMLSKMKEKRDATIVIQNRWRATLEMRKQKMKFSLMKESAVVIQCAFRQFLTKKKLERLKLENASAITVQLFWRSWILARKERTRFLKITSAVRLIQRVFRGFMIRKVITDCQILRAKRKCYLAYRQARQHPNRKICNRMNSALTMLLDARAYDVVYSTLEDLYSLSLLLPYCCERISEAGGTEVLCELISSSNRSFHAAFVQKFSINILLNLIRNPSTRYDTGQILGATDPKSGSAAVEMLVNVLSRFRYKAGRDPSHVLVFCTACTLLIEFCIDAENAKILKSKTKSVEMIQYINRETNNRMKNKVHKCEEARRKKERETVGYLSVSSRLSETSFFNHSSLLDITRETSFVHNMDIKKVSTPKTKRARGSAEKSHRGNGSNEKPHQENDDRPTTSKKSHSKDPSAKRIVSNLFGGNPIPPKLKESIIPQKACWHTNIPIHRSKKVTVPQSPKFKSGSKTKKLAPVGCDPLPTRSIQNNPEQDPLSPNLTDVSFDENDPLSSINALTGMLS